MKKRKSSKQLRNMVIALIVFTVIVLIVFVIFIFNVDIKKNISTDVSSIISNTTEEDEDVVEGVIAPEELSGATYESIAYDNEYSFQIKTRNDKVYFSVIDENKFKGKYKTAKIDTSIEKEVATHDYKVQEVYIQKCNSEEYLLVLMEDGSIGIMNIGEAVEENVFRIKNELITFKKPVVRIVKSDRIFNDETQETTIIVTSNGQMYDLQKFVE